MLIDDKDDNTSPSSKKNQLLGLAPSFFKVGRAGTVSSAILGILTTAAALAVIAAAAKLAQTDADDFPSLPRVLYRGGDSRAFHSVLRSVNMACWHTGRACE